MHGHLNVTFETFVVTGNLTVKSQVNYSKYFYYY